MITLQSVSKYYKTLEVLAPFDFRADEGSFTAFVGPSGSGKSTLLRLIARLEPASAGNLDAPEGILVFQEDALFPWLSLEQNVAFGLEMRGLAKAQAGQKARAWLKRVQLNGFETYYPHQVSGGMRQRAALARSLILEPELLLLDEPFGALDALTRLQLQDELLSLWAEHQPTVLLVTHDVEEAVYLADRVIVFSPRPARVKAELVIDIARPRARDDPRLFALKQKVFRYIGIQELGGSSE